MHQSDTLSIVVGCRTVDEFVESFHRLWNGDALLLPRFGSIPAGSIWRFVMRSEQGEPLLAGVCRVIATYPEIAGPINGPSMQLRFVELSPETEIVFNQLIYAWTLQFDENPFRQPHHIEAPAPGPRETAQMWRLH
jgi:hypothetical protein